MRESASWVLGARAAVVIATEALHLAHDWCKVWGMTTTTNTTATYTAGQAVEVQTSPGSWTAATYRHENNGFHHVAGAGIAGGVHPDKIRPATLIDNAEDAELEAHAAAAWADLYGLNPLDYEGDTAWESSYGGGYDARDTTVPGELFGAPYEVARDAYEGYRR